MYCDNYLEVFDGMPNEPNVLYLSDSISMLKFVQNIIICISYFKLTLAAKS